MEDSASLMNAQTQAIASPHVPDDIVDLCKIIAQKDYLILPADQVQTLLWANDENVLDEWEDFQDSWNRLDQDKHMKDCGKYRFRRHAVYSAVPASRVKLEPHQPHYQSLDYNTLNGGIPRHFTPMDGATNCVRQSIDVST